MFDRIRKIVLSFVNRDIRKEVSEFIPDILKSPESFKVILDTYFKKRNLNLEQKQMVIEFLVMNQHIHKNNPSLRKPLEDYADDLDLLGLMY